MVEHNTAPLRPQMVVKALSDRIFVVTKTLVIKTTRR